MRHLKPLLFITQSRYEFKDSHKMVINPDPKTVWESYRKVMLTHLKDFSVLKELNCLKFRILNL